MARGPKGLDVLVVALPRLWQMGQAITPLLSPFHVWDPRGDRARTRLAASGVKIARTDSDAAADLQASKSLRKSGVRLLGLNRFNLSPDVTVDTPGRKDTDVTYPSASGHSFLPLQPISIIVARRHHGEAVEE